ncbi:periplasmic substrate-binding domain-containing protein [Jatrophihabitans fulvus]
MRRSTFLVAPLAVAVTLLASCSAADDSPSPKGSGSAKGTLAKGGTFAIGVASDPGNLDPSMTPSSVARSVLGLAYDTLVYQKADGTFVSGLAQKWSSTATTATFTLRKDVTCSDGSKLTATDVADNVSYIANPKNASPLLNVLVKQGTTVKADDAAGTVTVTSPSADGFLLTELSGVYVICRSGLDDHKSIATKTAGTGPWVLKNAVANDSYDFAPRKGYAWGPDGAKLEGEGTPDAVKVRVVTNVSTTANLLLNGSLNMGEVTGPDTARLNPLNLPTIDSVDTSGEVWFNQTAGRPGADAAVREALVLGVDRAALSRIATGNNAQQPRSYITLQPNACASQSPLSGALPAPDVAKAKQLLDSAGWKLGSDGVRVKNGTKLSLSFIYDRKGSDARQAGTEYLLAQWKKLGVQTSLKTLPEAQLNQALFQTGAWDAAFSSFTFNLPSQMVAFVSGTPAPKGANFPHISNAAYDAAVQKATPKVGTASCADWARAEKALAASYNPSLLYTSITRTYLRKAQVTAPGGQIWGATLRLRTA